jgi:hypothetical protein
MTQLITRLFGQLDALSCSTRTQDLDAVVRDWCAYIDIWAIRQALLQWLKQSASLDELRMSARETATHYVWPVYAAASGHSVVINEFKEPEHMVAGYATTLHNHRYSFTSLMLSGRYRQVRCAVEMNEFGQATGLHELGNDDVTEGSIVAIDHNMFHRLADIKDRTITLVIRCPAVKESSISVDIRTLRTSRHLPAETRVVQLMDALAAADDIEIGEGAFNG